MASKKQIDQVRRFERMYEGYLRRMLPVIAVEDLTVAHSRVLHELSFSAGCSGSWLADRLNLDQGHVSRILRELEVGRLVSTEPHEKDGRARRVQLTPMGEGFATTMENDYRDRVRWALMDLAPDEQERLAASMKTVEVLLGRVLSRRGLMHGPVGEGLRLATAKRSRM